MLKYLIDAILYNNFQFNNYKNILELVPEDDRHIHEYDYNEKNDLFKIVKEFCINSENKKFLVSLSGGVDSMVLISIIHYLGYEVIGVHINYNNRYETLLEQEFLENWCNYNKIKLFLFFRNRK